MKINNKVFFVDGNSVISFQQLQNDLAEIKEIPYIIYEKNTYKLLLYLLASLLHDVPISIFDSDFSQKEIESLKISEKQLLSYYEPKTCISNDNLDLKEIFQNTEKWRLSLFTSGTTGIPKKVIHNFSNLTRMVKVSRKRFNHIWGMAFNPTHIAGIQVFFQAVMNGNSIINLFGKNRKDIHRLIEQYQITHISATPTFYRLLLSSEIKFNSIIRLSSGGEKFDYKLAAKLECMFPNAKILNIYASTEAGTLFAAKGDTFELKPDLKDWIKIDNDEILIHKNYLNNSSDYKLDGEYFRTGDLVSVIKTEPLTFKFRGRRNEMINVGGYKVNPVDVEELLNTHPSVVGSRVYGRKNSVLGNILVADIKSDTKILEKELINFLSKNLQQFKIPRIFNFVDEIAMTRTGKIKRL